MSIHVARKRGHGRQSFSRSLRVGAERHRPLEDRAARGLPRADDLAAEVVRSGLQIVVPASVAARASSASKPGWPLMLSCAPTPNSAPRSSVWTAKRGKPGRTRGGLGKLPGSLRGSSAYRYHAYVQWRADEQLAAAAKSLGRPGLYLDLPLGVHPGGFDVWREPDSFALSMNGGAPPDRFFTQGQNWGFAPMHPERVRRTGYSYFRRCLARHMQYAGILRVDHVMGLSRFFWVPEGLPASEGAYVQSRQSELFAVLAIEAVRSKTVVVGEDLGTVSANAACATRCRSGM